jgi:hypothetical protein
MRRVAALTVAVALLLLSAAPAAGVHSLGSASDPLRDSARAVARSCSRRHSPRSSTLVRSLFSS